MVRFVVGTGLPAEGETIEVGGVTLGEAIERLREEQSWLGETDVRYFVGGVDARRLEGEATPVGDEDTVLVASG